MKVDKWYLHMEEMLVDMAIFVVKGQYAGLLWYVPL